MTEVSEKKDVQKLQRTIVDSLEDVKAQDIQVFNTEHLSPLFERVVIACGTSNRQTKALAANVRDDVRDAGFGKPRIEGEENGEWIIVDCGPVVVHIMQPTIRQYYHLEEIWGDKPVRLKLGAAKPQPTPKPVAAPKEVPKKTARKTTSKTAPKTAAKTTAARQPSAKKADAKSSPTKKPVSKKTVAKKSPPRPSKP
jgi:ribosome-associated protein